MQVGSFSDAKEEEAFEEIFSHVLGLFKDNGKCSPEDLGQVEEAQLRAYPGWGELAQDERAFAAKACTVKAKRLNLQSYHQEVGAVQEGQEEMSTPSAISKIR